MTDKNLFSEVLDAAIPGNHDKDMLTEAFDNLTNFDEPADMEAVKKLNATREELETKMERQRETVENERVAEEAKAKNDREPAAPDWREMDDDKPKPTLQEKLAELRQEVIEKTQETPVISQERGLER